MQPAHPFGPPTSPFAPPAGDSAPTSPMGAFSAATRSGSGVPAAPAVPDPFSAAGGGANYAGPPGYAWPRSEGHASMPGNGYGSGYSDGYGGNAQAPYRAPQWHPAAYAAPKKKARTRAFRGRELAAIVAIVVGVDFALWHDGPAGGGFGIALFFGLLPLVTIAASAVRRVSPRLAVIGALAVAVALRCAYEPTAGLVFAGLGLTGAFAVSLRKKRLFVPDLLLTSLAGLAAFPSRVSAAYRGAAALVARTRGGAGGGGRAVPLAPVLVPIALVAVFGGVFALANPVVASALGTAWGALTAFVSFPSPLRIFFWTLSLGAAIFLLRPALLNGGGREQAATDGQANATSVQIARNALAGLNVLFLAYNGLDAKFLLSGVAPAGLTTQAYAHQGAFWLTVALLMLTAVIGWFFRGALAHDLDAKTTRTLAYAWMGQGLVLAVGTYRRIAIHIAHSGLSDLRLVGILGTTLVVCGVVLVALKLHDNRTFTWLVRRQLDASAVIAVLYFLAPTHALGAAVNVSRVQNGEYTPLLHAFAQTRHAESAASYLPLLHHPDQRVREGIGALLKHERTTLYIEIEDQKSWRSRDLASRRALAELQAHNADIDAAVGNASEDDARDVLLRITHVANEDRTLEEILSIPSASRSDQNANVRERSY